MEGIRRLFPDHGDYPNKAHDNNDGENATNGPELKYFINKMATIQTQQKQNDARGIQSFHLG